MKKELIIFWEKNKPSDEVVYILKETFASRWQEMKGYVGRPLFKMCGNYPMLKDAKYVSTQRINLVHNL